MFFFTFLFFTFLFFFIITFFFIILTFFFYFLFVILYISGSVHTEKFWRANCEKFKTKDFLLIRTLVAILRQAVFFVQEDTTTKADDYHLATHFATPISEETTAVGK